LKIADSKLHLQNSSLTGCRARKQGGALHSTNSQVSIDSSALRDNRVSDNEKRAYGGACSFDTSNVSIIASELDNNHAKYGGTCHFDSSTVLLSKSGIFNSTFGDYGAVYSKKSELKVIDSVFASHSSTSEGYWLGGCLHVERGSAYIARSSFTDSHANYGAALYLYETVVTVVNSLMARNLAYFGGGAIYPDAVDSLTLLGNQFVDNRMGSEWESAQPNDIAISDVNSGSSCDSGAYGQCNLTQGGVPSCQFGVCFDCPPGTFAQSAGGVGVFDCAPCPSGTFSNKPGASECMPLPNGMFAGDVDGNEMQLGATFAIPCRAGTKQAADGEDQWQCDPCDEGQSSSEGSISCYDCAPGTFTNAPGSAICEPCRDGEYSDTTAATVCFPCAAPYSSPPGSTSCIW